MYVMHLDVRGLIMALIMAKSMKTVSATRGRQNNQMSEYIKRDSNTNNHGNGSSHKP